jgi:hypothetical protein
MEGRVGKAVAEALTSGYPGTWSMITIITIESSQTWTCPSIPHPTSIPSSSSRTLMWLSTIFLLPDWREYDDLRPITSSHREEGNYF